MAAAMGIGRRQRARGVTYPVVLGVLMAMSIGASVTVPLASTEAQRAREAELLFRGLAYREAIRSYYHAIPGAPAYPANLEDLLEDPRFANRRHIRRLYRDPITGEDWHLIRAADGRITGVHSRSTGKPLKTGDFPEELDDFAAATRYDDWLFAYRPGPSQTSARRM